MKITWYFVWGLGTTLMTSWDEVPERPNNVPLSSLGIFSIKNQKMETDGDLGNKGEFHFSALITSLCSDV